MVEPKKANEELTEYLRPQTFPVAVRMLRSGEPIPEKARRPARDFKAHFANCQTIDMVRRYGWTIALTREDSICSLGIVALGLDKELKFYSDGNLCAGMYTETPEAGARSEAAVDKFAHKQYDGFVAAPLERANFEPDLVVIYANPAQVMRLVQGALWKRGGKLTSSFGGRIDCAEIIVTTLKTQECQVILPCSGDRIFGQTQDHEMAFSIPWGKMEEVLEGLRGTHKGGIRYPVTQFMQYEGKFPPQYLAVNKLWDVQAGKDRFTGKEHVVAAYKRTFTDRIPVYPIIAAYAGVQDGLTIREYCSNPQKAVKAQLNAYETLQHDVVLAYTDLAKEAEAMGCEVKYSDTIVPSIGTHVLGEEKGKLARMELPDPKKVGRLPGFLELCEGLMAAKVPAAVGAVVTGPWTVAMLMRGPENLLLDTVDEPQFVHDLMRFTTEFTKQFGDLVAATKIGLSLSEPTASCSLISPDDYRTFIKPYHKELIEYYKQKKVNLTTHICGMTHPLYEDLVDAGFATISIDIDPSVDQLKRLVEVSNKRAVAIGNVDATIFERATAAQMEAEVKRCVATAARHSAYILSTSCEIPPMSRPELVQAFMDAAREHGRYERFMAEAPTA